MEVETPLPVMNNELVPVDVPMDDTTAHTVDEEISLDMLEIVPNEIESMEVNVEEQQQPKRRKKKSIVWEHFTIENVGAGCRRACCKQCKQSFAYSTGSKVAGTSHLKRHIAKGTCPVLLRNQERNNQQLMMSAPPNLVGPTLSDPPKRRYRMTPVPYLEFDAELCRKEISKMIIMHEYPLHIVEHPGFISFVKNLQPRFDMVSFNTVQGDCVATYLREKQGVQKLIESTPGRISLTLDLWSSSRTIGYVFVTGQFVDFDWKIHRKLLNVIMEPYPESDNAFSHSVAACLSDWSVDGKLLSVTINRPLSDAALDNLRALISVKNPLMLNGQLLAGNCLARSLSNIVQETLASVPLIVKKVRDSVKYVKISEEKFIELRHQLQVSSAKSLSVDDKSRWDSTYEMLSSALELEKVFSYLDSSDPDYKNAPSTQDWMQIETLCTYLKPLFDTANLLTSGTVQTTNAFFHEAWKIQLELARASNSEDSFVSSLTKSMKEKFDAYWKSCYVVLAIAVVMDPRFKMKLVEFSFSKIYGEESATHVKIVDEGIHELFQEYLSLPQIPHSNGEEANGNISSVHFDDSSQGLESSSNGLEFTDFDVYIMETTSQESKSELDRYLEESLLPRVHDFDVLGWWKVNRMKYPTLSKMARDVLSIPVCTVPAESVFDTVPKEMDSYRCSLRPETVEALVCAKNWLKSEEKKVEVLDANVKMEVPI